MKFLRWQLLPVGVVLLLVGFLWLGLKLDPRHLSSARTGQPLPAFNLPGLLNSSALTPQTMQGHIAILNVWGSWCPACIDEQVFLMKLAQEGTLLYGLNYKDTPDAARQWLETWGNPYQMTGYDQDGKTVIDLGVYGAPETFLIDPKGIIQYRHVGTLNAAAWEKEFLPRIKDLERHE